MAWRMRVTALLLADVGFAHVVTAQADGGDALAGRAELTVDHVGGFGAFDGSAVGGLAGLGKRGCGGGSDTGGGGFEEVTGVPWGSS